MASRSQSQSPFVVTVGAAKPAARERPMALFAGGAVFGLLVSLVMLVFAPPEASAAPAPSAALIETPRTIIVWRPAIGARAGAKARIAPPARTRAQAARAASPARRAAPTSRGLLAAGIGR